MFPKPGNLFSDAHHGFQTFSCGEHLFVVKIAEGLGRVGLRNLPLPHSLELHSDAC
jgi:hypothetical protein